MNFTICFHIVVLQMGLIHKMMKRTAVLRKLKYILNLELLVPYLDICFLVGRDDDHDILSVQKWVIKGSFYLIMRGE